MEHASLANLVEKLKSSPRVRGIFLAGTTATKLTSSSDIDLIIILDRNSEDIRSVFTTLEGRFSDIFFFDIEFIKNLRRLSEVSGNDAMFLAWLSKGKIEYDPENLLSEIKNKVANTLPPQKITDKEKRDVWVKVNYNFIANTRYFNATDTLYHEALELRLLYSVIELVTAYFSFRGIPWRGEKAAITYLQENDPNFLSTFRNYSKSDSLGEKMRYYEKLFDAVFFGDYQKWENDFIIPISNKNQYNEDLKKLWDSLVL